MLAREFRFTGTVQGVGFRPWIYRLALDAGLKGWVLNDGLGVLAHVEGTYLEIEKFKGFLAAGAPPLAQIESCTDKEAPIQNCEQFEITESQQSAVATTIPADTAVCLECLDELFNPESRRYRHPFINCTHCGPRFTITKHLPYDRPQTSMAEFPMCPKCDKEYHDPLDRRFHAQPTCCPDCGPQLELRDADGKKIECEDPIRATSNLFKEGKIVAVKGLGGFHLVCDAKNDEAVSRLRQLKNRPSKPFAVMGINIQSFDPYLEISKHISDVLHSSAAPIVLCQKKEGDSPLSPNIAPGLGTIGIMLPHTPIQWLLFHEFAGRPEGLGWVFNVLDEYLVMTSANKHGEPLITDNEEAVTELKGIAEAFLVHNRDIYIRCDDSVLLADGDEEVHFIRRGRGFVPKAVSLSVTGPSVLATGSWLKNTACLTRNSSAFMTQHIGDLDRSGNCRALGKAIEYLEEVLQVKPKAVACDLHPDFYSTILAERVAISNKIPLFRIQHHHAHIAAVLATNHLNIPVIGVAMDGVGLGTNGTSWGGEILFVNGAQFARLAHLKSIPMPGGDKCSREGWRVGLALAYKFRKEQKALEKFSDYPAKMVLSLLKSGAPLPLTSSLGRLFDAASALLGVCAVSTYEGEAAMKLQAAAGRLEGKVLNEFVKPEDKHIDLTELTVSMLDREDTAQAAADFHETVAYVLAERTIRLAKERNILDICVAGGCCLNRRLVGSMRKYLEQKGLRVWEPLGIPSNDGGLALGQAWIALQKLNAEN